MKYYSILFFIFSRLLFAEYPYVNFNSDYDQLEVTYSKEVSNITPTKSQDGIGLCYGFSGTTLLENYRCNSLGTKCLEPDQQMSPLDVASFLNSSTERGLEESGSVKELLLNVNQGNRKIVKESCAKYGNLVRKIGNQKNLSEESGWLFLTNVWKKYKAQKSSQKQNEIIICTARELRTSMKDLNLSNQQIIDAFKTADSLENFLYKTLIPYSCLNDENLLAIPPFEVNSYPAYKQKITESELSQKVETVLMNNIPLEISICTEDSESKTCPAGNGHAITLTGIQEACSPNTNECHTLVKVKNSYGWNWQKTNNNGWLDLNTIIKASRRLTEFQNIVWINKPGKKLEDIKLARSAPIAENKASKIQMNSNKTTPSSAQKIPEKWKNFKGLWKCEAGNSFKDHFETGCVPYMDL